jgi:hypothetical protein
MGCHASTVLRQVRRVEAWRDDPLVDEALEHIGTALSGSAIDFADTEELKSMVSRTAPSEERTEGKIEREARRILRRLCEKGAFLAVAPNMEKAVVLREVVPGKQNRIAVVEREVAHAFALQEWISCDRTGKISCYSITAVGRAALKRLLTEERRVREPQAGFAEAQTPFQEQHKFYAERVVMAEDGSGEQRLRFNLAESPLTVLGRKRDKDGEAYLTPDLIEAGERLREDFELAQMGPRITQNWDKFLTAGSDKGGMLPGSLRGGGSEAARARVAAALSDLGPGLGDTVLRVCCFLEGLEATERRMGWSARSGKIVLRIALQRLRRHYDETEGRYGGMIG